MANKYVNPTDKASEAMGGGNFMQSAAPQVNDRFTKGGRQTPNHNPKQPWLGLPIGTHTHAGARDAVHDAMCPTPGFDAGYTGMAKNMPAASDTPKSMANKDDRKVQVMRDDVAQHRTDVPKGKM